MSSDVQIQVVRGVSDVSREPLILAKVAGEQVGWSRAGWSCSCGLGVDESAGVFCQHWDAVYSLLDSWAVFGAKVWGPGKVGK